MLRVMNLSISLDAEKSDIIKAVSRVLSIGEKEIEKIAIVKKSIDARKKEDVHFVISVDVCLKISEDKVLKRAKSCVIQKQVSLDERINPIREPVFCESPVVVGLGPGGLFAALYLARSGFRPIVIERGEPVEDRKKTVERLMYNHQLNEESNFQFGEGGAGAFSDGKLTTGIKDPRCRQVLRELVDHGAPEDILILAHPHVGTDQLPHVVRAIREEIVALGGKVLFRTKWIGINTEGGHLNSIILQGPDGRRQIKTSCLLAAIGHSAVDTQRMLIESGVHAVRKPFSIGFRIEHLQSMVNQTQYGPFAGHPSLPPAEYKLYTHLKDGRGVYTFCMCPGGFVIPATSRLGCVCVNGMSRYLRNGQNANSAVLVDVRPEDCPGEDVLAGYIFQKQLEEKAFHLGGGDYSAPCQLVGDFLKGSTSTGPGSIHPTYLPGVRWTDLNSLFPEPWCEDLKIGLRLLNRQLAGFIQNDAVLTAPETRSSCPVRYTRDEHFQTNIRGLYLVGEGAGHAGGIMSSAVDGLRCAASAVKELNCCRSVF